MKYSIHLLLLLFINIINSQNYDVTIYEKIANNMGGLDIVIDNEDWFGYSVEAIGDLNGDGFIDMAVGALKDDGGGYNRGAIYILFLNENGSVINQQKISDIEGGFNGGLDDWDIFGSSLSYLGDINGDGYVEIGVGAEYDGDGGYWHGAIWILSLNNDGTVYSHVKISDTEGNFNGYLGDEDVFGTDIEMIGDLNGDGNKDIAVSARRDPDGGSDRGAVYILFLNNDLTVSDFQKISDTEGGFEGNLDGQDYFGGAVTNIGDLDNDGVKDLAVGAYRDDDGGENKGAVYILFMNSDGTVKDFQKISQLSGGFNEILNDNSFFGQSIDYALDINGDGFNEIIVGARGLDANDEQNIGAFFILNLKPDGTVNSFVKYSEGYQYFDGDINDGDAFGFSVSYMGLLTEKNCIGVGACFDDVDGFQKGSVWVLQLGEVLSIESLSVQNNIYLYPNPAKNAFSINDIKNVKSVQVFNLLGEQIVFFDDVVSNLFNVAYLPVGEYIILLENVNGNYLNFKLLKD